MNGKGSRRRPSQITRQEEELRWQIFNKKISMATFTRRYNKLKKAGLVTRSGKVVR